MKLMNTFLGCLMALCAAGQNNTMYIWEPATQTLDSLGPFSITSTISDTTPAFTGYLPGSELLANSPPTSNLFSGSEYLIHTKASELVDRMAYPSRAAVKIFGFVNGVISQIQTGFLVGEKMVMTTGHGVMDTNDPGYIYYDSVLVAPSYDDGELHPSLPTAIAKRFYLFKEFYENVDLEYDVCLLELETAIGWDLGWIGIGFQQNETWFDERVFHKISWPVLGFSGFDFNGDTMYYSYGAITADANGFMFSENAIGFPGESGSAWMQAGPDGHYCYGIAQYSADMKHLRFSPDVFYGLSHFLGHYSTVNIMEEPMEEPLLWPQPANTVLHIRAKGIVGVQVFDIHGKQQSSQFSTRNDLLKLDTSGLASGMFILHLETEEGAHSRRFIKR